MPSLNDMEFLGPTAYFHLDISTLFWGKFKFLCEIGLTAMICSHMEGTNNCGDTNNGGGGRGWGRAVALTPLKH